MAQSAEKGAESVPPSEKVSKRSKRRVRTEVGCSIAAHDRTFCVVQEQAPVEQIEILTLSTATAKNLMDYRTYRHYHWNRS